MLRMAIDHLKKTNGNKMPEPYEIESWIVAHEKGLPDNKPTNARA